jgi:prepilin-type N-terminal cleavage/methylation domain-containing protein
VTPELIFEVAMRRAAEGRAGRAGFTLIELLIVVAIIAILALIAIPNFLEAQVRAKVARLHSDMRSIAVALEVYMVDWNDYPERSDEAIFVPGGYNGDRGLVRLSTPVAYISSIPLQPFQREREGTATRGNLTYEYASTGCTPRSPKGWAVYSCGPDMIDDTGPGIPYYPNEVLETQPYDPTNGTVSQGDVLRFSQIFPDKIRYRLSR